jgi:hypothetical protein
MSTIIAKTFAQTLPHDIVTMAIEFLHPYDRVGISKEVTVHALAEISTARKVICRAVSKWLLAKREFLDTRADQFIIHPQDYLSFYPMKYRTDLCESLVKAANGRLPTGMCVLVGKGKQFTYEQFSELLYTMYASDDMASMLFSIGW